MDTTKSSTDTSYLRGNTIPNKFRRTKTLDELSDLLDRAVRCDAPGNMYDAEAIERMVRARVIRFCKAGEPLPELPKSRDLQDWQEWFIGLKATQGYIDLPPIKVERKWKGKAFELLRKVDSDPTRKGIKADARQWHNAQDWLRRHQKRRDIVATLTFKDGRIITAMRCGAMFSEKS